MKQTHATVLGFIAAAILPAAYLAVAHPLSGERDLESVLGSFIVFQFFVAAAMGILGVPTFIILEKYKLVRWWSASGAGALVASSALAVTIFGAINLNLAALSRFAMLGSAAGFIFWIFWRAGSERSDGTHVVQKK